MIRKTLLALTAALSTATLIPLSALASPQGNFQPALCGNGASGDVNANTPKEDGIFSSTSSFDTTITGNTSTQRAGYELNIKGLTPVSQHDGFGWQNCEVFYLVPANSAITLSDLHVFLQFNDGSTLTNTFAGLGANSIPANNKRPQWQALTFTNRDFAGQGRTLLLTRLVVYQENTSSLTTQVSFGRVNVFHFEQGGITAGTVATNDGGCSDLNLGAGTSPSVTGNSLRDVARIRKQGGNVQAGFNPLDPRRPR